MVKVWAELLLNRLLLAKKNIAIARQSKKRVSKALFKHEYKKQIKRGMPKDFAVTAGFGKQYAQFGESGMKRASKHYTAMGKVGKLRGAGNTLQAKVKDNLSAARMVGRWGKGAYNHKQFKKQVAKGLIFKKDGKWVGKS